MFDIIKNFSTIKYIAKTNLKKENKATSLGALWQFLAPLITAITFGIVFAVVFPGEKDGVEQFPWIIAGFFPWIFISDSFYMGSHALVWNKHLITKLVFPIELLPLIELVKNVYKFIIMFGIMVVILAIYGIYPTIYWIQLIYAFIATYFFIYGITKLMSALIVLFRDIGNLISSVMQMLFWASGVVWSINEIAQNQGVAIAVLVLKLNPFLYLVNLYRQILLSREWFWEHPTWMAIFWITTIILIIVGERVFKKFRNDFADVL